MLQITTPPEQTDLTTVDAACAEVGQLTNTDRMAVLVAQASATCESFCGRSFARTAVTETLFRATYPLLLTRAPVVSVTSVTEGDTSLSDDAYVLDLQAGILHRDWWHGVCLPRVVIVYTAGYLLPGQDGQDLPADVERACLEVVKALWFAGGDGGARDPWIRSESVEGIGSTSYLDPQPGNGGLPELAAALLRPDRPIGL